MRVPAALPFNNFGTPPRHEPFLLRSSRMPGLHAGTSMERRLSWCARINLWHGPRMPWPTRPKSSAGPSASRLEVDSVEPRRDLEHEQKRYQVARDLSEGHGSQYLGVIRGRWAPRRRPIEPSHARTASVASVSIPAVPFGFPWSTATTQQSLQYRDLAAG